MSTTASPGPSLVPGSSRSPGTPEALGRGIPGPLPALLLAILAALCLLVPLLVPAPAQAVPPASVRVTDTVGVLDPSAQEELRADLADLDFRETVTVEVLVLDVQERGFSAADDRALNDAVLDHAREEEPSLLAPGGDVWADGTVILALDPENRFLGTYAGEDVALSEGGFEDVQEAMRDDAQDGDWEAALLAGGTQYASLLGRPGWQHPGVLVAIAAVPAAALVALAALLSGRASSRRRVRTARETLATVTARRLETDAAARELRREGGDTAYVATALAAHEDYTAGLADAAQADDGIPGSLPAAWGLSGRHRERSRTLEEAVRTLDEQDDAVIDARDLLLHRGDWERLWREELAPLEEGFAALGEALELDEEADSAEQEAAEDLRQVSAEVEADLPRLTAELRERRITAAEALELLDEHTSRLSAAVAACRERGIDRLADDEEEISLLRDESEYMDAPGEGAHRGLRARHWSRSRSEDGTAWHLSPVFWLSEWRTNAPGAIQEHRNPGSTGSSTSGYSPATSGGFSGAGSSSRF